MLFLKLSTTTHPRIQSKRTTLQNPLASAHITAGTKNVRSSQGAAATTTSQRLARCASTPPIVRARAHRGGHEERTELPGSSRHDDIAATYASCVTRAKRPNANTSRRARGTRGAPREQPPQRSSRRLCVVRQPGRLSEREHIAAGTKNARSSQGAAATTTSRRPARRASPAPSDQTRAHRAQRARRGHGAPSGIIVL